MLADSHGNVIHLGERDCSIQRRHQKLIEEAPGPHVDEEMRERIGKIATDAAKAVDYRGAGTIEGMQVGEDYFFLEMNTRVQVEHCVTEMVTGIDIVREQVRIAAGEELSITQDEMEMRGHAIECRINAEAAHMNFAPAPGPVDEYKEPSGPGVRVDSVVLRRSYSAPAHAAASNRIVVLEICGVAERKQRIAPQRPIQSGAEVIRVEFRTLHAVGRKPMAAAVADISARIPLPRDLTVDAGVQIVAARAGQNAAAAVGAVVVTDRKPAALKAVIHRGAERHARFLILGPNGHAEGGDLRPRKQRQSQTPGDFAAIRNVKYVIADGLRFTLEVVARETVQHSKGVFLRQLIVVSNAANKVVVADISGIRKPQQPIRTHQGDRPALAGVKRCLGRKRIVVARPKRAVDRLCRRKRAAQSAQLARQRASYARRAEVR